METEYLTKEKFEGLSKELDELKTTKRKEVADQLEYAKSLGDLSENAEYHEARDLQAQVEDRIMRLENILKNAKIVSSHSKDVVNIGSTVQVEKKGDKETKTYTIVSAEEANLSENKISAKSPFGESIMGKKKGETFDLHAPSGTITYKIIDIK